MIIELSASHATKLGSILLNAVAKPKFAMRFAQFLPNKYAIDDHLLHSQEKGDCYQRLKCPRFHHMLGTFQN